MLLGTVLAQALSTLSGVRFEGTLYRAIDLEALYGFHLAVPYSRPRPLFGLGAPASGARFTPRHGMATLYMAEDPLTAFAEASQVQATIWRSRSSTAPPSAPTVIVSARARLESVLDLTTAPELSALATTAAEILSPWRPLQGSGLLAPTQALGQGSSIRVSSMRFVFPPHALPTLLALLSFRIA